VSRNRLLRKAPTWAVVLSASDSEVVLRHSVEAVDSSGRRASSGGTGDATVLAGDKRSGVYGECDRAGPRGRGRESCCSAREIKHEIMRI
jgi:hypothetical protein